MPPKRKTVNVQEENANTRPPEKKKRRMVSRDQQKRTTRSSRRDTAPSPDENDRIERTEEDVVTGSPAATHPVPVNAQVTIQEEGQVGSRATATGHANSNITNWIHDTSQPVRQTRSFSLDRNEDAATRIANAMEQTLRAARDASISEHNSSIALRLKSVKDLPDFSGDPLEWINFREAYKLSTDLGGYTDRENINRLFKSLKGDARESVKTLLATTGDADAVIRTLDLQYGNKNVVAQRIINDIQGLPSLESGHISITRFAAKLQNAVEAFKSLNLTCYLSSPDLLKSVASKLPLALKYVYNRFSRASEVDGTELERLSKFLYEEAELAVDKGIFDLETRPSTSAMTNVSGKQSKTLKRAVVCTTVQETKPMERNTAESGKSLKCAFCERTNHHIGNCHKFAKESISRRQFIVQNLRLCFKCLRAGHRRNKCRGDNCPICKDRHHVLLHKERGFERNNTHKQRPEHSQTTNTTASANTD